MVIGVLTLELEIPAAHSLKEKRMVLNRVIDRVRNQFNVAVAEVEEQDVWNRAVVAVVAVSNQQAHTNRMLSKVIELVETIHDCNVADVTTEFL